MTRVFRIGWIFFLYISFHKYKALRFNEFPKAVARKSWTVLKVGRLIDLSICGSRGGGGNNDDDDNNEKQTTTITAKIHRCWPFTYNSILITATTTGPHMVRVTWFFAATAVVVVLVAAAAASTRPVRPATVAWTRPARPVALACLDRHSQRDVMNGLRGVPAAVARPGDRTDDTAKAYLTRLRNRFSHVLDRPWDSKYASHRNVKKWPL